MPLEKLTRARVVEAFNLLGEFAEQEQVTLELCLYGGRAMMLAYSARETTKDVDVQVQGDLERFYPDEVLIPKLREIIQGLVADKGDQP